MFIEQLIENYTIEMNFLILKLIYSTKYFNYHTMIINFHRIVIEGLCK